MDTQAFNSAKAAYQSGNWAQAATALAQVKAAGEVSGEVDHLRGNALMKLGQYAEAAQAYSDALKDSAYGHVGALSCNCGRALVAAGSPEQAVPFFQAALNDSSYATPYKAHLALGNIYSRNGMAREAGVAWRNAAIDETNPDPSGALTKLGGCFMQLGRPVDAIEAYRTALDFSSDASQGAIYADLGLAYMSSNRIAEAADAFGRATSDANYQLSPEQQAGYTAAQKALAAASGNKPSDTDQMLANAGYGLGTSTDGAGQYDPLDPMGQSGAFMPSPEDTGFFSVTEEDLMQADKIERKNKRGGHGFLKFLLVLLIIAVILAGAGAFAYFQGYGWPTQESVVNDMFSAASNSNDITPYFADSVTDEAKTEIEAILPVNSSVAISGVDRSVSDSTVLATATLANGGTQDFEVSLVRSGLSWKVLGVELSFASNSSTTSSSVDTSSAASTEAASVEAGSVESAVSEESPEGTTDTGEGEQSSADDGADAGDTATQE